MTDGTATISVIGKYVDGLEVSVFGEPRWSVFEILRQEKSNLRASPQGLGVFDTISRVPGGPLLLTTKGGSTYQFVLLNAAISRLEVTSRGALPKVMMQFRAAALYEYDLEEMGGIVEAIAFYFLKPGFEAKVSSLDLAFDFQCAEWRWPDVDDVVCRARKHAVHYEGTMTGMTFGKGHAPLQVVIYDKSEEIRVHHKEEWMEGVWAAKESFRDWLPVIRTELRFSRNLLKDFDIETISDLRSGMGDLIHYAVGGERPWFRVASPETRRHGQDRRDAASWWENVSRGFLEDLTLTGRIRERAASSIADPKRARSTLLTYAVQTAAWEKVLGHRPADSPEEYLGPLPLEHLPDWLAMRGFGSWGEAVDSYVQRFIGSGKAPAASVGLPYLSPELAPNSFCITEVSNLTLG